MLLDKTVEDELFAALDAEEAAKAAPIKPERPRDIFETNDDLDELDGLINGTSNAAIAPNAALAALRKLPQAAPLKVGEVTAPLVSLAEADGLADEPEPIETSITPISQGAPEQYEDHPYAGLFPLLGEADLAELAKDIKCNGLQEPITLFEGKILDGRNRYRACLLAGVAPSFRVWAGAGTGSALDYVVSTNLHRRHLTDQQRALVAAGVKAKLTEEGKERRTQNLKQNFDFPQDLPKPQECGFGERGKTSARRRPGT